MLARVHDKNTYEEVDARTLDDILCTNNVKRVDWLKIDVEGAEFEVLNGATYTLRNNPNLSILLEVHDMDDDPQHYDRILNFFHSFGFSPKFELVYPTQERHAIFHH
jgi:hypothetical protein